MKNKLLTSALVGFLSMIGFRKHIQSHEFRTPVIIQIRTIGPHRRKGRVGEKVCKAVSKCAVSLIDVQVVWFDVIIADVNIWKPILIKVVDHCT